MKKAMFFFGLVLLFLSSLAWAGSSSSSMINMSGREFITMLVVSLALMAPELVHQVQRFLSSGQDQVPF